VTLAAAPLLAASVTRDPRAIGAVGVAWSLPWLLFALVSGAVVDRSDRRRLMVGADLVRVVGLAGLTAAVVGGRASIPALAIENIVEMAGLAMLVLLAQDVLGLDARGYGLLLACLAVGGVLGGNGGPGCTAASATRAAWSGRSCS
jgi:MFS family permease